MGSAARQFGALALGWCTIVGLSFILFRLAPGDPAEIFAASANIGGAAFVAELRAQWGLDRPVVEQFWRWLGAFIQGDWGRSFVTGRPVAAEFAARLPWSLAIGLGGLAAAAFLGFVLGFAAARRPGGAWDTLSRGLAVAGQALPAFAVGLVLLWYLSAELRLVRPLFGGPVERLLLPILLVGLFSIGGLARITTAAFAEIRTAPFYLTARAKGLGPSAALWRHGRGHAGLTLAAALTPEAAWVVGGTAVAEIVFGTPGLSEFVLTAVANRDFAVLQGYVALIALWLLAVRGLAELARRSLDPRPC